MIRAIGIHAWLLLTLRHDGTGLPKTNNLAVIFLFGLCLLLAAIRWSGIYNPYNITLCMLIVLMLISIFGSVRAATGYAIISAAIDLIALVLPPFAEVDFFFEDGAAIVFALRLSGLLGTHKI